MHPEIARIESMLGGQGYVADREIATAVYLSMTLRKPLLIEGAAGVGKTEVAKVMAAALRTDLIRLQCYEGLDATTALYEWNYQKQLLHIRLTEQSERTVEQREQEIFGEGFLLKRPLLEAITRERSPVLLIDEVDRCVSLNALVATSCGYKYAGSIRPGDELVSFNPNTFLPAMSTVTRVIGRETGELLRILVGGRIIEVTAEHKFVRFSEHGHEIVRADALQLGDRLPIQSTAPMLEKEPEFTLSDSILKIDQDGKRVLHAAYKQSGRTYEQIARRIGISRNHLRNVIGPRSCRQSFRADVLRHLCQELGRDGDAFIKAHARGLRGPNPSVAFYEVLGYLVADGCFAGDHLEVADKDRENLRIYSEKFAEAFGEAGRIQPGPHRNFALRVWSLPLGRFLKQILGAGFAVSRSRAIPEFIFALPTEKRAAFVRGFFDGEGWVGDHQVCAVSSSAQLIVGIQILLASVGVEGRISKVSVGAKAFGQGTYYSLIVSDTKTFAERVGFCAPAKAARLSELRTSGFLKSSFLPMQFVSPILEEIKTRSVLHRVPHHQTIHDILAGRVKANPFSLRQILSSFQSTPLQGLLDGGIVLGTVTAIERIPGPHSVIDLVLSGQPYFVANQVVTHNCDSEFEAFLLEVLSDFQVSIPEIGTIRATAIPHVVLTSNRTRELGDALRRRCLYLWIEYPTFEKELQIVLGKVPGINADLAAQVAGFMQLVRQARLDKIPGIAETIDWGAALMALHRDHLDREAVEETLGVLFKSQEDARVVRAQWLGVWLRDLDRLRQEPRPWDQALVERIATEGAARR